MSKSDPKSSGFQYSLLAKTFHWGFVLLFLYGIYKQVGSVRELADTALLQFEMYFAGVFLALLALRFAYMRAFQRSALSDTAAAWKHFAAKVVHLGMYASMGLIAASGIVIGWLYRAGYENGLWMNMATELHEFSVQASYYLIGAHVLAAIYHRILGDGVWGAMVPFAKD